MKIYYLVFTTNYGKFLSDMSPLSKTGKTTQIFEDMHCCSILPVK